VSAPQGTATVAFRWAVRVVAVAGLAVVSWSLITAWGAVIHGNPAYLILLAGTAAASIAVLWRSRRSASIRCRWRRTIGIIGTVAAIGWLALMVWLRPFAAVETALAAMTSDASVTVSEYPTQIVMTPTGAATGTGVFFQPGARVDARAYAGTLRPLAEAGHTVVITKQPLGIAFLSIFAFGPVADALPEVSRWIVGGHSLGGTVASMQAEAQRDRRPPITGLLLYASYPASDMSDSLTIDVLSVSGSNDGLATPEKIVASRADLPETTIFVVIEGGVHAYFGDYGPQPGDGTPTISQDLARKEISEVTLEFVNALTPPGT